MKQIHLGIPGGASTFAFQIEFECPECNCLIEVTDSLLAICMEEGNFVCPITKKITCPNSKCNESFEIKLSDMDLIKTEYEIIKEQEDFLKKMQKQDSKNSTAQKLKVEEYIRDILHEAGITEEQEKELRSSIYKKQLQKSLQEKNQNN